jgi:hypothetical protein
MHKIEIVEYDDVKNSAYKNLDSSFYCRGNALQIVAAGVPRVSFYPRKV